MLLLIFFVSFSFVFGENFVPRKSLFILNENGNILYNEESSFEYNKVKLFVQGKFVGDLENDDKNWYVEGKIDVKYLDLDKEIEYEIIRYKGGDIITNSGRLNPRFDCTLTSIMPRQFVCESHNVAKRSLNGHFGGPPHPPCHHHHHGPMMPPPGPFHHHHHNFHSKPFHHPHHNFHHGPMMPPSEPMPHFHHHHAPNHHPHYHHNHSTQEHGHHIAPIMPHPEPFHHPHHHHNHHHHHFNQGPFHHHQHQHPPCPFGGCHNEIPIRPHPEPNHHNSSEDDYTESMEQTSRESSVSSTEEPGHVHHSHHDQHNSSEDDYTESIEQTSRESLVNTTEEPGHVQERVYKGIVQTKPIYQTDIRRKEK